VADLLEKFRLKMIKIRPDELKIFADYIHRISGIYYDQKKAYLFETRLGPLLEETGLSSYLELYHKAKADGNKFIEKKIIDAITTNETLFFRDSSPFELLRNKILPDLIDARTVNSSGRLPTPIRIWSAACSTGQEVYSTAIVLKELLPDLRKFNIRLLGTDISDEAVKKASYGEFSKFEVERGLAPDKLQKYFSSSGEIWKIRDEIRSMVTFKKINLTRSFQALGKFDIVLCRNVAIYFSPEDRRNLFEKLADILEPDGVLIIGSAESLSGVCTLFEPRSHLRSVYYQLK
jgi:chemotaxis protein methyltransferase CheR